MASRLKTMKRNCGTTCRIFFSDFIVEAIDLNPACVRTFRKAMGRRGHWPQKLENRACVEDKLVQRAVVMILEQIYEVAFHETSYGFRPQRSCHQALSVLGQNIATKKVNWISDADIKGFFDNVCHERLDELLRIRISDPKLLALILRFLKAGVMIEGQRFDTEDGVPQGASLGAP
jgi:hypothetical protein